MAAHRHPAGRPRTAPPGTCCSASRAVRQRVREFNAEFTTEELGALADLADGGRTVLPAGAYVDLLLAVQDAVQGHARSAVRDLRLLAPLELPAETVTALTTRWRPRPGGGAEVEVFTVVGGEENIHATAVVAAEREPLVPVSELAELDATLAPAGQQIDDEDIYTDLASVGRPQGPACGCCCAPPGTATAWSPAS
ncbi:polyketide synthase dehydratase domain-containing protein [Streptomyces diastatochromogenes]|nr:polyketide synthase dehydratase domain-containing protein [Streptomyces diastatochromogenes]